MFVFLKTLDNNYIMVEISPHATVFQLKQLIQEREGLPVDMQSIFINEQLAKDDTVITDHNAESFILLLLRFPTPETEISSTEETKLVWAILSSKPNENPFKLSSLHCVLTKEGNPTNLNWAYEVFMKLSPEQSTNQLFFACLPIPQEDWDQMALQIDPDPQIYRNTLPRKIATKPITFCPLFVASLSPSDHKVSQNRQWRIIKNSAYCQEDRPNQLLDFFLKKIEKTPLITWNTIDDSKKLEALCPPPELIDTKIPDSFKEWVSSEYPQSLFFSMSSPAKTSFAKSLQEMRSFFNSVTVTEETVAENYFTWLSRRQSTEEAKRSIFSFFNRMTVEEKTTLSLGLKKLSLFFKNEAAALSSSTQEAPSNPHPLTLKEDLTRVYSEYLADKHTTLSLQDYYVRILLNDTSIPDDQLFITYAKCAPQKASELLHTVQELLSSPPENPKPSGM